MATHIIHLATPTAQYDITIGTNLLGELHSRLQQLTGNKPLRCFVVTSPQLWALWSKQFLAGFPDGAAPVVLFVPPGEQHKRLSTVERLAEELATHRADRDTLLLAFGGGVIGDITGFLAAIYMRGIPYVHIPTTLLAQVDSSVGGKTGVNLTAGKNLVGSFHHPLAVFADVGTLQTLPENELFAGLQEAIKAAIIRDLQLFSYVEQNTASIREKQVDILVQLISRCVQIKADIVAGDEREAGLRMLLNFGHTLGHAIEAATGYKQLLHGEAVAWGSIAALHLALARGTVSPQEFTRMVHLILAFGPLPTFDVTAATLVALTASDKKARSGRRAYVLPVGIGKAKVVHDVTDTELLEAAASMLQTMRSQ